MFSKLIKDFYINKIYNSKNKGISTGLIKIQIYLITLFNYNNIL